MKRYEQGSVGMLRDKEGSWCEYEEAQAEIERLRDILRECDLALSFMPQPSKTLRALRERAREALGEQP